MNEASDQSPKPESLEQFASELGLTSPVFRNMIKPLFLVLKASGKTKLTITRFQEVKVHVSIE